MKKVILILLMVLAIMLTSCNNVPKACNAEFDFSTARISSDKIMPESQYVAKSGNNLFFSDVVQGGGGQTEIKIDIVQRKLIWSRYYKGEKETKEFYKGDENYSVILDQIRNLSEKYLKEAMIIEGYDKENQMVVEKYKDCIKKLD